MLRILSVLFLLLGLAAPAAAQQPQIWADSGERLRHRDTAISLPRQAGPVAVTETGEFSHEGQGVNTHVQYKSADREVWATVYLYLPGIAHPGLAALATEHAMAANSDKPLVQHGRSVVAAGGKEGTAIRATFGGYLKDKRSSSAFVKAGRWLVKIRVSGPEARAREVDATMTALLDGIRFEGESQPAPAEIIDPSPCAPSRADATPAAYDATEISTDAVVLGGLDPAGVKPQGGGGEEPVLARVGRRWCSGVAGTGKNRVLFLRAIDEAGAPASLAESVLLILYSDAGGILEAVRLPEHGRHVLMNHSIVDSFVLGALNGAPSDAQIARYLSGEPDDALRTRAKIRLAPNGDTRIEVPGPEPAPTT